MTNKKLNWKKKFDKSFIDIDGILVSAVEMKSKQVGRCYHATRKEILSFIKKTIAEEKEKWEQGEKIIPKGKKRLKIY